MAQERLTDAGPEEPVDLHNALTADRSALETWRRLKPAERQAHIDSLESGADPLARERCVQRLVDDLSLQVVRHSRR